MSKTTILFSESSIDSSFATMIVSKSLQLTQLGEIETIPYNRALPFKTPTDTSLILVVGVELLDLHLGQIIDANPGVVLRFANKNPSNIKKVKDKNFDTYDLLKTLSQANEGYEFISVTDLIIQSILPGSDGSAFFNKVFPLVEFSNFIALKNAITKYSNFSLMTQEEILLVHKNIRTITNALMFDADFEIDQPVTSDELEYAKHVKDVRAIITRNFSMRHYAENGKWVIVPTINVSAENCFDVMRLISYSYDDIIAYEDLANYRLYQFYSKSNINWFIKCMKASDVWTEGNITFMKTEIPPHDRK